MAATTANSADGMIQPKEELHFEHYEEFYGVPVQQHQHQPQQQQQQPPTPMEANGQIYSSPDQQYYDSSSAAYYGYGDPAAQQQNQVKIDVKESNCCGDTPQTMSVNRT